jgi:hypothetical protein
MGRGQNNRNEVILRGARLPWHEVKKVDHYYLSVDAMTQPIKISQGEPPPYEKKNS